MEGESEVPCGNDQGEHRIKAKETMNGKTRAEPGRVSNPGDEGDSRAPDTVPLRKVRSYPKIQQENPATDKSCSLVWRRIFPSALDHSKDQTLSGSTVSYIPHIPYPKSHIPYPKFHIPYPKCPHPRGTGAPMGNGGTNSRQPFPGISSLLLFLQPLAQAWVLFY